MRIKPKIDWSHFLIHGGLAYLVLAVICFVGAGFTLFNGLGLETWPGTMGIVTMSYVDHGTPDTSRRNTRYRFAYEYQVDEKTYRSDRHTYSSVGGEQSVGVNRYKKEDRVTVFYDPNDPSSAILAKQEPGLFVYLILVLGLGFLLAAIGSLLAQDAFALFHRSGWVDLREQLTNRREQAIERLAGADTHDPETLVDALQDPLLRECLEYLADTKHVYPSGLDSGRFRLENAARHVHKPTGIELETAREMMRILAKRRGIDLSVDGAVSES